MAQEAAIAEARMNDRKSLAGCPNGQVTRADES